MPSKRLAGASSTTAAKQKQRQQPRPSQQSIEIEDAWLDQAVARRLDELKQRTQAAKETEQSRLRAVQRALLEAEASRAAADDEAAHALSSAREQARLMGMRLQELEDERQRLLSVEGAWQSVEARLRVTIATERCAQLAAEVDGFPSNARAQLRTVLHDIDEVHHAHERTIVLSRHVEALDSDRWLAMRESVEHLLDVSEEAKLTLATAEGQLEERAKARAAVFHDASVKSRATLAPLKQEVDDLKKQIEAVLLQREAEMVQKRKEWEANAKAQGGQKSGAKPPPPVPNGLRLAEEERQLRADVAALSDEIVALNEEEDALTLQASKLPPPAPKKKGAGAGAKKPNTILVGKDKPPPPKGTKLDAAQCERLAALKGKYGEHVANKMAPGGIA